jgi:predicted lipoprotein with Yx(FWY)xxD motif
MTQWTIARFVCGAALVFLVGAVEPAARGADYTVDTAVVWIQGTSKQVLTDAKGMTLYYLITDTPTRSTCTGGCTQIWPPLLSGAAPTSKRPLLGKVALVKTENGPQVSYNGHLLYRYAGDAAPGLANGLGMAGRWWVAGIDLSPTASGNLNPTNGTSQHREGEGGNGGGMGGGGMGGR